MKSEELDKNKQGTIDRVLAILELFAGEQNSLSIQDLVDFLGIPQSTCFRIVRQLQQRGFIKKYGKRYGIGPIMLRMARQSLPYDTLRQAAKPVMKHLAQRIHQSIALNVLNRHNERLCIERIHDPLQELRQRVPLFTPLTLTKGASGKVLWAYLPEKIQYQVYLESADTIGISWEEARRMLENIKEHGYCYSKSERLPGASAISVPLLDEQNSLIASLSISLLALPFINDEDISSYVVFLQTAAINIIKNMTGSDED